MSSNIKKRSVSAFLSAFVAARRQTGADIDHLLEALRENLDGLEKRGSPLSNREIQDLKMIRVALEKYLSDPQLSLH